MAFLADAVLDALLSEVADNADTLHLCSAAPSSFANVASVTLGNKPSPSIGSPADASPDGRKVTVAAISDGEVTGTGTATHWALVDAANSVLLAWAPLSASQAVTDGNTFTLEAFDIRQPDAA